MSEPSIGSSIRTLFNTFGYDAPPEPRVDVEQAEQHILDVAERRYADTHAPAATIDEAEDVDEQREHLVMATETAGVAVEGGELAPGVLVQVAPLTVALGGTILGLAVLGAGVAFCADRVDQARKDALAPSPSEAKDHLVMCGLYGLVDQASAAPEGDCRAVATTVQSMSPAQKTAVRQALEEACKRDYTDNRCTGPQADGLRNTIGTIADRRFNPDAYFYD
jgi:hypothetical protein